VALANPPRAVRSPPTSALCPLPPPSPPIATWFEHALLRAQGSGSGLVCHFFLYWEMAYSIRAWRTPMSYVCITPEWHITRENWQIRPGRFVRRWQAPAYRRPLSAAPPPHTSLSRGSNWSGIYLRRFFFGGGGLYTARARAQRGDFPSNYSSTYMPALPCACVRVCVCGCM
jgi:hypothetical protein